MSYSVQVKDMYFVVITINLQVVKIINKYRSAKST